MRNAFRRFAFAVPFGSLVAIATHFARFGDEHAFGGEASETLVATTIGAVVAMVVFIINAFLSASTTITTGTIAAARARRSIPGALAIFAVAASMYYGIETLEGNGIELGLPTFVLAALAVCVAYALRRVAATFALFVAETMRDWLERLARRERHIYHFALDIRPLHARIARRARRFGRAPPDIQRSVFFAV